MIGFAVCGSFCTHSKALTAMRTLSGAGYDILPIMSETAFSTSTRFGSCTDFQSEVTDICKKPIIHTIDKAEPLGPKIALDALVIAPCTGNTLAKISCAITDTSVAMAAKAHLRCDRPLVIALATNDAMSANLVNIGNLLNRKNIFFVPMSQDDPKNKPHSLVADFQLLPDALDAAFSGNQLRPLFR